MTTLRSATLEAPAKVNLFLRVLDRRPDGFHELETLFQMLELSDRVRVEVDPHAPPGVMLDVDGPDLGPAAENLAVRAAEAFLAAFSVAGAVRIALQKRIPAGGGLGGGSSDAAAVLRLLALLALPDRASADVGPRLVEIAGSLGSDVPFFLCSSPLARGRGRGERLTELTPLPARPVVLSLPPVHVSTAGAYRSLAASRTPGGTGGSGGTARSANGPADLGGAEWTWHRVEHAAENDFEPVVAPAHAEIATSLDVLRRAGARPVLLSGSGAASFGVFERVEEAAEVAANLTEALGWPVLATMTRTTVPEPVRR